MTIFCNLHLIKFFCFVLAVPLSVAKPKPSIPRLERISYHSDATGLDRDYYVYLPEGFNLKDKWPILLFLHGNGERGDGKNDLDYVFVHGPIFEAWSQKRHLPFVIIAPQLPIFNQGDKGFIKNRTRAIIPYPKKDSLNTYRPAYTGTELMNGIPSDDMLPYPKEGQEDGWNKIEHELLSMIDHTIANFKGDADRVYLTGLSTGGFGVWYMGGTYPERFAAIAPVNAFGHPDLAPPLAKSKLPIWCITGGRDPYVKIQYFYPMMNKLESLDHTGVRFTIHEDMGHIAWQRAYAGNDLYDWFLNYKKSQQ